MQNTPQLELGRLSKFGTDDYIGMESCVDLKVAGKNGAESEMSPENFSGGNISPNNKIKNTKHFPPSIPLPWVLKRHYTADGRLILTEEKVTHHHHFHAHRSDGRLTMHLVAVTDLSGDGDRKIVAGDSEDAGKCLKCGNVGATTDSALTFGVARPGSLNAVQS